MTARVNLPLRYVFAANPVSIIVACRRLSRFFSFFASLFIKKKSFSIKILVFSIEIMTFFIKILSFSIEIFSFSIEMLSFSIEIMSFFIEKETFSRAFLNLALAVLLEKAELTGA